ncbi:hypothetical protein D9M68_565300 [compost metagenome]
MAKLSPSRICTVVEARRVVMRGSTVWPASVLPLTVAPVGDSSDTSGATFRWMRPFASTVGVNFSPTPNSSS